MKIDVGVFDSEAVESRLCSASKLKPIIRTKYGRGMELLDITDHITCILRDGEYADSNLLYLYGKLSSGWFVCFDIHERGLRITDHEEWATMLCAFLAARGRVRIRVPQGHSVLATLCSEGLIPRNESSRAREWLEEAVADAASYIKEVRVAVQKHTDKDLDDGVPISLRDMAGQYWNSIAFGKLLAQVHLWN